MCDKEIYTEAPRLGSSVGAIRIEWRVSVVCGLVADILRRPEGSDVGPSFVSGVTGVKVVLSPANISALVHNSHFAARQVHMLQIQSL